MWRCGREGWPDGAWLLVAAAAVFWGMATVVLSIARYTTPAVAVMGPFVGYWGRKGGPRNCRWPSLTRGQ